MINSLTASANAGANNTTQNANLSLLAMQADMAAAIKNKQQENKQQDSIAQKSNLKPAASNDKSSSATAAKELDAVQLSRVIEMAWEDRTPFEAIEHSYALDETAVIKLMRQTLKPSSFRLWRQRVTNRATKHQAKRPFNVGRAYCKTQYKPR
ncbi:TIGR03643 family protein [Psychrobacter sp. ANT_H3]|nr:TIGR03643 family protein [Psychrobacter sp. ANT_H3]MDA5132773.1 TIGR03643 family protein [Psychrobacter sp. ANT_H3]